MFWYFFSFCTRRKCGFPILKSKCIYHSKLFITLDSIIPCLQAQDCLQISSCWIHTFTLGISPSLIEEDISDSQWNLGGNRMLYPGIFPTTKKFWEWHDVMEGYLRARKTIYVQMICWSGANPSRQPQQPCDISHLLISFSLAWTSVWEGPEGESWFLCPLYPFIGGQRGTGSIPEPKDAGIRGVMWSFSAPLSVSGKTGKDDYHTACQYTE